MPSASTDRTPAPAGGSVPLAPWLEHLELHLQPARRGEDPEAAHQVRVAAARLDVWLRLDGRRILRDDLRWLRRAAAPVRDIDVMLAREVPDQVAALLRQQRLSAQRLLTHILDRPRTRALLAGLGWLPALDAAKAMDTLVSWSKRTMRAGRRLRFREASPGELHALRGRVRRLRYAHEWLGLGADSLRAVQEELGALNDYAIARRQVLELEPDIEIEPRARAGSSGGVVHLERRIDEQRRRAARSWRAAMRELVSR